MKKLILFFLFLLPVLVFSQDNYMSLNFGTTLPLGDFKESSQLSEDGFALRGFAGDYTGAWMPTKYFGLGADIKFTSHTIDEAKVRELLQDEIPEDWPEDLTINYSLGIWKQVAIIGGPHFTLPANRINADVYALFGLNFVMPPEMDIRALYNDDEFHRRFSAQNVSFALDLGFAIRYHLSESYSLRLYTEYFRSKSKGDIIEEIIEAGPGSSETKEDYSSVIQTFNVGIGVVYRL